MNTEKKGQRAKNLIQKKRGGRRKELLSETLTDTQKRYVQLCTKKNVKPTDTLYRALGYDNKYAHYFEEKRKKKVNEKIEKIPLEWDWRI